MPDQDTDRKAVSEWTAAELLAASAKYRRMAATARQLAVREALERLACLYEGLAASRT